MPRVAVVGHVEWIEFARVPRVPHPGEIVHVSEWWEEVGGGGAVAAVQLVKLAGQCDFFTALGDDENGRRARERLEELGVTVFAAPRAASRSAAGSSTSTATASARSPFSASGSSPHGDDDLPWERLDGVDSVYFSGGDVGALRQARRARKLVATPARVRHAARTPTSSSTRSCARPRTRASSRPSTSSTRPRPRGLDGRQGGRRVGRQGSQAQPLEGRRAAGPAARRLRRRRLVRRRA